MNRLLPVGAGLVVIISAGVLHGLWTERWQQSAELEAAVARLGRIKSDLGPWKANPGQVEAAALQQAAVAGSWIQVFSREGKKEVVAVFLLCGRSGPMSVHRPEHCYKGAGYDMVGEPALFHLPTPSGKTPADFWTARFRQQTATGPVNLRIYWTWFTGASWLAPDSPRLTLARYPAVYKLYVVREMADPGERLEDNPATQLLGRLIPELTRALAPP
jgi:hypothetical protein